MGLDCCGLRLSAASGFGFAEFRFLWIDFGRVILCCYTLFAVIGLGSLFVWVCCLLALVSCCVMDCGFVRLGLVCLGLLGLLFCLVTCGF